MTCGPLYLDDLLWIVTAHADGAFCVWALENLAYRAQGSVRPILLQTLVRTLFYMSTCCPLPVERRFFRTFARDPSLYELRIMLLL